MQYRIVLINAKTNERRIAPAIFTSKRKALAFCEQWKRATPNADAEIKTE